jgi:hypothetical protein
MQLEPLENAPGVSALKSALAGSFEKKRQEASPKEALIQWGCHGILVMWLARSVSDVIGREDKSRDSRLG